MNTQEAAALLAIAAAFDNRKPDADAAKAWSLALDGLRFEDARDAIVAHYRASTEWLMPAMVRAEVKRIRAKRIGEQKLEPPRDIDPDDTLAYRRWLRATQRALGDGEQIEPPAVVVVPMPKELAAGMTQFGRLPADHRAAKTDPPTEGA